MCVCGGGCVCVSLLQPNRVLRLTVQRYSEHEWIGPMLGPYFVISSMLYPYFDESVCSVLTSDSQALLSQGRSQAHSPGWARIPLSSFFPQISISFFYFSSNFTYFLPHFGPPGGRVAHPGRPWLRHCS